MANSLNRDLKTGDKVVMKATGESVSIALESFGCFSALSGTKICVTRGHGDNLFATGHDIDADETVKRHSVDNGWSDAPGEHDFRKRAGQLRDKVMQTWTPPSKFYECETADIAQTATMQTIAYIMGPEFLGENLTKNQQSAINESTLVFQSAFQEEA